MSNSAPKSTLTLSDARKLPKIVLHEHLDCSPRAERVLRRATELDLDIPVRFKNAWRAAQTDEQRTAAAQDYQHWLQGFARESLTNYLTILWAQVLPTMQTQQDLYELTKERIEDACNDGIVGLVLRFAPQLHRRNGLTLQQVIDPVQKAVSEAPIPVRLMICSLRHEDGRLAWHLANSVIKNPLVTSFDLAGDESKFPGVLPWWARQAKRVANAGKQVTCHIGEVNAITPEDHAALDELGCTMLGHGIKGDPRTKLCTICVTSNLVTHLADDAASHPIDHMYREGKRVSIDLDGTLLTGSTSSAEYCLLAETFGWGHEEFLQCNLSALQEFPVDDGTKRELEAKLRQHYCGAK